MLANLRNTSASLPLPALCQTCRGSSTQGSYTARQKDFGDFFVPRNVISNVSVLSLELIAVRVRASARTTKSKTSLGFPGSSTFFTIAGTSDGLLRFYDASGALIHTEAIPQTAGQQLVCTAEHVLYGTADTRPFLAVGTSDGRVLIYELNIWAFGKLLLGDRRVHKRAAAEAALKQTAAVQAARKLGGALLEEEGLDTAAAVLAAQGTHYAVLANLTSEGVLSEQLKLQRSDASHTVSQDEGNVAVGADGSTGVLVKQSTAKLSPTHSDRISSMEIFAYNGERLVIVGDTGGFLSVWGSDGIVQHVFTPRPAALATTEKIDGSPPHRKIVPRAITALAKGSSVVAYAMGSVIGFISISRKVFQPHVCQAVRCAPFTHIRAAHNPLFSLCAD
jgi:hypothetical protein